MRACENRFFVLFCLSFSWLCLQSSSLAPSARFSVWTGSISLCFHRLLVSVCSTLQIRAHTMVSLLFCVIFHSKMMPVRLILLQHSGTISPHLLFIYSSGWDYLWVIQSMWELIKKFPEFPVMTLHVNVCNIYLFELSSSVHCFLWLWTTGSAVRYRERNGSLSQS